MRKRFAVVSIAAAIALVALPSGASAATEIGNVCKAEGGAANDILVDLAHASSALPVAVPATGVVTQWKVTSGISATEPQILKVFKPGANKNEFGVVAESAEMPVVEGPNVFDTRIPVAAGERFGLWGGSTGALYCSGGKTGDEMGILSGNMLKTDAPSVFNVAPVRVAVSAVVEPDVDGDGFGDETQDKCPQSAQFQTECPQVGLEDFASVGRGSITMLVIADHEAPVTVTATTKGGKSPKRHPLKGGVLLKGGTQTVKPNQLAKFKLKFSKPLKAALGALPKGKSLTLTITASATNLVGQQFTKTTTLKLKG